MSFGRENRSEMERGAQKTLTLDDTAMASHRGQIKVSFRRWARRYPKWPAILAVSLVLSIVLTIFADTMFVVAVPLALMPNVFYWNRIREHFQHGDANPGIIVSSSPLLVAVRTDMSKGDGSYPMLRILREAPWEDWGATPQVGTRIATIALYGDGEDENLAHWERFEPRPVAPVAAEAEHAKSLLTSFDEQEWSTLEQALELVESRREGLHRVPEEGSSWVKAVRSA